MPEGHTIHRIAGQHRARFAGRPVSVTSPQGRFLEADRLDGRELRAVEAYGKHLLYEFDGRRYVHVHLGLFGKVRTDQQPAPPAGLDRPHAPGYGRLVRRPGRSDALPAHRRRSAFYAVGTSRARSAASKRRALIWPSTASHAAGSPLQRC